MDKIKVPEGEVEFEYVIECGEYVSMYEAGEVKKRAVIVRKD